MKKSDIYEITIKILGLYLFFTSIGLLRDMLTTFAVMTQTNENPEFGNFDQTPFFILSIANFVFVVIFSAFLTFKTKSIVSFVCNQKDFEETSSIFADRKVIYEIALVIMGLLLIIWTLPDFAFKLKNHFQTVQNNMLTIDQNADFIFPSIIKIIIGIVTIIYAKSIATILEREK